MITIHIVLIITTDNDPYGYLYTHGWMICAMHNTTYYCKHSQLSHLPLREAAKIRQRHPDLLDCIAYQHQRAVPPPNRHR